MSQTRYLQHVLFRFGLNECKLRSMPCELNPDAYYNNTDNVTIDEAEIKKYRQMVSSLTYTMTCTRPDLSFAVTKLSQHLSKPTSGDWTMLKHVFRYIKQTVDYTMIFSKSRDDKLRLYAYCDADWASSLEDRRSTTGYCVSLNEESPPISWKSKKQASIALSTCEAEYMSLSNTAQEVIHLRELIINLVPYDLEPTLIKNDNQGAIALIKNPMKHAKSKHIDIRYHFIRECYQQNRIVIEYVPSKENTADVFTKLPKRKLLQLFEQYLFGH